MGRLILVHASKESVVEQWNDDDCDVRVSEFEISAHTAIAFCPLM
jgi:hypothetical protein